MENKHLEKLNKARDEVERLLKEYQEELYAELKGFQELSTKNTKIPSLLRDQEK